jgi:Icc protein
MIWLTDLHLDQATRADLNRLTSELSHLDYDAALITGDITIATSICDHLEALALACKPRPMYFVLGNHDFYHLEMARTYDSVKRLCRAIPNLTHLQGSGPVLLSRNAAIVGHHGWADARAGWGKRTFVTSPDHQSITDFHCLTNEEQFLRMETLGRQSANALRNDLFSAFRIRHHVIVATHVPPFPSTARYNGVPCGPCHRPHFTNLSVGAMLIAVAKRNQHKKLTVLAGHTHNKCEQPILRNLHARVGSAWSRNSLNYEILNIQ